MPKTKDFTLRLAIEEYDHLNTQYIQYMAKTGQKLSLTAYIKLRLDLIADK